MIGMELDQLIITSGLVIIASIFVMSLTVDVRDMLKKFISEFKQDE